MMVLLTALSTLGGASWGAFEFYSDYKIIPNIDVGLRIASIPKYKPF